MIENFEERYEKLLEEANSGPLSDDGLKSAENGFIKNYCLDRKNSNKILKSIKVVLFATSLSLLNPMCVEAEGFNPQETIVENKEALKTIKTVAGVSLLMLSSGLVAAIIEVKKFKKELDSSETPIFLGKLSDESNDDVNEAVKYLKLTNALEVK